jgi:hypothetical protein
MGRVGASCVTLSFWCPEPESNRYAPITEAADLKNLATAGTLAFLQFANFPNPSSHSVQRAWAIFGLLGLDYGLELVEQIHQQRCHKTPVTMAINR